jgi:hypothetical protein
MAGIESLVLEGQVIDWVMGRANVIDEHTSFDALMNPEKGEVKE